ncbi:MAG: hypothetical protein CMK46_04500 [Porticoccus sp.]|nr:hypothetical protein [Porticoccus sp.]
MEGHTDNVPVNNRVGYTNWELSANRAIATYQHLISHRETLANLLNTHREPLFGVAGYAEQRPVIRYNRTQQESANRRIDLRFLMTPPSTDQPRIIKEIHKKGVR